MRDRVGGDSHGGTGQRRDEPQQAHQQASPKARWRQ